MKRFLSIDWDYFIKATMNERMELFPDGGNENLPKCILNYIWKTHYSNEDLKKIQVAPEYKYLLKICREFRGKLCAYDSHEFMYDFAHSNTEKDEEFEVYNFDFHHDFYDYRRHGERINCGNWGTILKEDRPNMKYFWIKREDSDTMTLRGDVSEVGVNCMTIKEFDRKFKGKLEDFDYLYMCKSSVWSPPHLDKFFLKAMTEALFHCESEYEKSLYSNRLEEYKVPDYSYLENLRRNNRL